MLPCVNRDWPTGWKRSPPQPTNRLYHQPLTWDAIPQGVSCLLGLCWDTFRSRRSVSPCSAQASLISASPFIIWVWQSSPNIFSDVPDNHQVSLSFRITWSILFRENTQIHIVEGMAWNGVLMNKNIQMLGTTPAGYPFCLQHISYPHS